MVKIFSLLYNLRLVLVGSGHLLACSLVATLARLSFKPTDRPTRLTDSMVTRSKKSEKMFAERYPILIYNTRIPWMNPKLQSLWYEFIIRCFKKREGAFSVSSFFIILFFLNLSEWKISMEAFCTWYFLCVSIWQFIYVFRCVFV